MVSKKFAVAISTSLVLFVLVAASYTVVIPRYISYHYKQNMQAAAGQLASSFHALSISTELPLITNDDTTEDVKKDNAGHIVGLLSTTRSQIEEVKAMSESITIPPYSDVLGQYSTVRLLQAHTMSLTSQTEDAVSSFEKLINYLDLYNQAVDDVLRELNSFNTVTDINIYAGQAEQVSQVATRIRAKADMLSNTAHPHDMQDLNTSTITAFNDAAKGFDELADGLAIPADDPIYAAALRIEEATVEIEFAKGARYDEILDQSRIIRDIQDLEDKLELILGL